MASECHDSAVAQALSIARSLLFPRAWSRRKMIRELGLVQWARYEVGFIRFLWLAETGQIGFREDELEALARRGES